MKTDFIKKIFRRKIAPVPEPAEEPVQKPKKAKVKVKKEPTYTVEVKPVHVDKFDELLSDKGFEIGSTTLISGGAGTGKTTFCMQSIYHAALKGEKGVYISFEERPERIIMHMKKNFGWDFDKLQKKGLVAIIKLDPSKIARMVEGILAKEVGSLHIKLPTLELPIKPDRICIDSLSALSIAFEHENSYRKYIRELFEMLEEFNSINLVIGETEQDPKVYSRSGVEEFLADGVVVLYNIRIRGKRRNALEILKLRSGSHVKEIVPYKIGKDGIEVLLNQQYD